MQYDRELNRSERNEDESFDKYRARRKEAQATERARRALSSNGNHASSRHGRRHPIPLVIGGQVVLAKPERGSYGRDLIASIARKKRERWLAARGK